jgi:hypothetical protein
MYGLQGFGKKVSMVGIPWWVIILIVLGIVVLIIWLVKRRYEG